MAGGLLKSHKIRALVLYPLYVLSRLMRRDAHLWLFGPMNHAFLDNAKYLFLHVLSGHPEIRAYFVTEKRELLNQFRQQGIPVLYKWSLKGLYCGLKAKYYIISAYVDDINFWTSGGAKVFNLWHGIPLKKIEFDINTGPLARRYQQKPLYLRLIKPYFYRRPDFVLSTAPEVSRIFAGAFRVPVERCPALGYPRTDIFFWPRDKIIDHIERREPKLLLQLLRKFEAYDYVLLYMPTWRDDRSNFLQKAFPDVTRLNDLLASQNALLLVKLHPNDVSLQTFGDLSHINVLKAKLDIYPLLPFTSALITDYSSIYFDYLLLKKPIIFYPFDFEQYVRLRSLYFKYEEAVCPPVVRDFNALCNVLTDLAHLHPDEKYRRLLHRFWAYRDGQSSARIVQFLLQAGSKRKG